MRKPGAGETQVEAVTTVQVGGEGQGRAGGLKTRHRVKMYFQGERVPSVGECMVGEGRKQAKVPS